MSLCVLDCENKSMTIYRIFTKIKGQTLGTSYPQQNKKNFMLTYIRKSTVIETQFKQTDKKTKVLEIYFS